MESEEFLDAYPHPTRISWSQEAVLALIRLWRAEDCLYNPKNRFYHNKRERSIALDSISQNLQHVMPNMTQLEVKTKINYLRSQYGRELLKIRDSQTGETGRNEVYVPSAYWFQDLSFLRNFVTIRKTKSRRVYAIDDNSLSEIDDPLQFSKRERVDSKEYMTNNVTEYDESTASEMDEPTSSKIVKEEEQITPAALESDKALAVNKDYVFKLGVANQQSTSEQEYENSFTNFFRTNIREIRDKNLQDEVMEKVMLLIFEYKRKQRQLDRQ